MSTGTFGLDQEVENYPYVGHWYLSQWGAVDSGRGDGTAHLFVAEDPHAYIAFFLPIAEALLLKDLHNAGFESLRDRLDQAEAELKILKQGTASNGILRQPPATRPTR